MIDAVKTGLILFTTIVSYVSFIPQIVQLYRTKQSEDISIPSWLLWTASAVAYLIFTLLNGDKALIFSALSEVVLTTTVLYLSWRYRR